MQTIAALFVLSDGPYVGLEKVEAWPELLDARTYTGPHRVIAHPDCSRWGRYWSGGPSARVRKVLGDDGGCFESALLSVRIFGGILEHPEASHAWRIYGLNKPPRAGGWVKADEFGGWTCCISQGWYNHPAQKLTWLYANGIGEPPRDLIWGPCPNKQRLDEGYHSAEERRRAIKTGILKRLSSRQRKLTPDEFRDLLLELVRYDD